jgi:hypothetical protein
MAVVHDIGRPADDNPDEILARLMAVHELRLRVRVDEPLGCVSIDIGGLDGTQSALLAPCHALDLAHQLIESVMHLRRAEPAAIGPFSASF